MEKTYTTKQGDTWDAVAYLQMGSCAYTKELMWANRGFLGYYIFPAGIVLTIPEIIERVASTAPPWKQVSA